MKKKIAIILVVLLILLLILFLWIGQKNGRLTSILFKDTPEASDTSSEETERYVIIGDTHNDTFFHIDTITFYVNQYRQSEAYANDDVSVRVEKIASILYEMEESGHIQPDGVYVSKETALVSRSTIDGALLHFECADEDNTHN